MATYRKKNKDRIHHRISWDTTKDTAELNREELEVLQDWATGASAWDFKGLAREFFQTAWDYKFLLLVVGLVIFTVASNLLLQGRNTGRGQTKLNPEFKEGPRIPASEQQVELQQSLQRLRTTVYIGSEALKIQVLVSALGEEGHLALPDSFYNSIHFGISAWNPFGLAGRTEKDNLDATKKLREELSKMSPKPTMVFKSKFNDPQAGLYEEGYVVRFSVEDLRRQGVYIPRKRRKDGKEEFPWKHAREGILRVARKFGKLAVVAWYPNQWGHNDKMHVNIIQEVFPTRAGLQKLRCNAVAWRG